VLLLENKLIADTADAIPELVRHAPQLAIIVQPSQNNEPIPSNSTDGVFEAASPAPSRPAIGQVRPPNRRRGDLDRQIDNQSVNLLIEAFRSQALCADQPLHLPPKEQAIITCVRQGMRNCATRR